MRIVSYSLWGDNPKYTEGAVVNAMQVSQLYPGWTAFFYCAKTVPDDVLSRIGAAGAVVRMIDEPGDNRSMFWRFWALDEPGVERVIFRDSDSRLSHRECVAVDEWVVSGHAGHIMRDHPWHNMLVMGGMWGCVGGVLPSLRDMIHAFCPHDAYSQDQLFLARHIYPLLRKYGVLVHDEFFRYESDARPFPVSRCPDYSFVGEAYGAGGVRDGCWRILQQYEASFAWRALFKARRLKARLKRWFCVGDGCI